MAAMAVADAQGLDLEPMLRGQAADLIAVVVGRHDAPPDAGQRIHQHAVVHLMVGVEAAARLGGADGVGVQAENGVTHLISEHLTDLTPLLNSVGGRDDPFTMPHGRGDEARTGSGPDVRTLRVPTRDFR